MHSSRSGQERMRSGMRPPPGSPPDRRVREYSPPGPPTSSSRSSMRNSSHYRDYDDPYPIHHHSSSHHHDVHRRSPPPPQRPRSIPYKILCVANLNSKVTDGMIRDALQYEFSRFGDVSVKVCHDGKERIAYVYFRCYEEAREGRHAKYRMVLFDKQVEIEPIYDRGSSMASASTSSAPKRRSVTPEYDRLPPSSSRSSRPLSPLKRYDGRPLTLPPHMRDQQIDPHPPPTSHSSRSYNSESRKDHQSHVREPSSREYREDRHASSSNNVLNNSNSSNNSTSASSKQRESKKEKFPNYLHHIAPEEDDKATRTLFVGNLEVSITDAELRRIFERYGRVEDIDVKRPAPGQGNAYAFIKFLNLDMAHRAKVEMSGQYIGKFQCKIGYGKATPTTRIWVGGLGSWTSLTVLEREFDRFGAIRKIDFVRGENHAYVQYDSIDAAQAACQEMRGAPLGGPDKRLRVDFADPGPYSGTGGSPDPLTPSRDPLQASSPVRDAGDGEVIESADKNGNGNAGWSETTRPRCDFESLGSNSEPPAKRTKSEGDSDGDVAVRTSVIVSDAVTTICDLVKVCPHKWTGCLILKNSAFPTKMLFCSGDESLVDQVMLDQVTTYNPDSPTPTLLRITQRLKLEPTKLTDLTRRLVSSGNRGHCVLLALPSSAAPTSILPALNNEGINQRGLKNLIAYLKQKEAAGVVSITSSCPSTSNAYVFPPCQYALELINKVAPNITDEAFKTAKEDFTVVVVIRGSSATNQVSS